MRRFYFLILVIILIISAGILIYYGQRIYPAPSESLCFGGRCRVYNSDLPKQEESAISILLVGDIMLDRKVERLMQKNGFSYPFAKINQFLNSADFVFGNLEGPIVEKPMNFSDASLKFAFDTRVLAELKSANFKVFSLANNHTLNMGQSGLVETKKLLEESGIDWVGDPWECSLKLSNKESVVFVAFNKTFSGCSDEKILEIVKLTKSSAPEKFLIVSLHWGNEYNLKSSSIQRDLAHKIIDVGGDLIVGHHPHVVQEIEKYNNKLIFYSLGNFIFDQYFSKDTQEGLAVRLELYAHKVVYKLYPIKSELSQPYLMNAEEAKILFERLDFPESIEIAREQKVCFEENCFYVELAQTAEQKNRGLMLRENLAKDRGMLFIFEKRGEYPFWMKNTLIPLDIIWLDENKEIVYIEKNAQPCKQEICPSINPHESAKYVLEINAGTAAKIGLKTGDRLFLK